MMPGLYIMLRMTMTMLVPSGWANLTSPDRVFDVHRRRSPTTSTAPRVCPFTCHSRHPVADIRCISLRPHLLRRLTPRDRTDDGRHPPRPARGRSAHVMSHRKGTHKCNNDAASSQSRSRTKTRSHAVPHHQHRRAMTTTRTDAGRAPRAVWAVGWWVTGGGREGKGLHMLDATRAWRRSHRFPEIRRAAWARRPSGFGDVWVCSGLPQLPTPPPLTTTVTTGKNLFGPMDTMLLPPFPLYPL